MSKIDNTRPGHIIEDEGIPLTQRTNLSFIGTSVVVTDNPGTNSSDVTISGGSGGSARAFAYFIS